VLGREQRPHAMLSIQGPASRLPSAACPRSPRCSGMLRTPSAPRWVGLRPRQRTSAASPRPAASRSAAALSVLSHVKSWSSRPKWP
jgi:hypothetical protein